MKKSSIITVITSVILQLLMCQCMFAQTSKFVAYEEFSVRPPWGGFMTSMTHPDVPAQAGWFSNYWFLNEKVFVFSQMQDPAAFIETAKKCFSRKELRLLCRNDVLLSVSPVVKSDGHAKYVYRVDLESRNGRISPEKLKMSSFTELEEAFCRFFIVDDAGFFKYASDFNGYDERTLTRAFSIHFSPDGTVSAAASDHCPWIKEKKETYPADVILETWGGKY